MHTKNLNKTPIIYLFFTILCACLSLVPFKAYAAAQDEDAGTETPTHLSRVLCLSSYNYSFSSVPDQLTGLSEGMSSIPVDLDYEFMDAKNFYKSEDLLQFHDYLAYRMAHSEPFDLVILCDDTALHFGVTYRNELFKDIPMVFMGINNVSNAKTAAAMDYITGIAEVIDFEANLNLMQKLFPERTQVHLVFDNTDSAQGAYIEFQRYFNMHYDVAQKMDYTAINASEYKTKELEDQLALANSPDSIILYFDCLEDGSGNHYTLHSGTKLITEHAPDVPIWRVSLSDMGQGVFGGISYSHYDAGVMAGQMAVRILTGTDPNDIPLETSAVSNAFFDQAQMDRFGITADQLPENATILNQRMTPALYYKQHTVLMNLVFLVGLLLLSIIIILILVNIQRAKVIHMDFLTQMPNRLYITHRLSQLNEGEHFGLIMMDVDHFKSINDTLGHLIGDELLVEVAKRLKSFDKKRIIFARIGGDEFIGLIFDANLQKAEQLCKELVAIMKPPIAVSCGDIHITISVGSAVYPDNVDRSKLVQSYADAALYEVKKNGRDGYQIFYPSLEKNIGKSQ